MTGDDPNADRDAFDADLAGFAVPSQPLADSARDELEQLASRLAEQVRRGVVTPSEPATGDAALAARLDQIAPVIRALEQWKHAKATEYGGDELPAALPVDRLGEYRLIREIGRGGNAFVFEARHTVTSQHVALKVYPRKGTADSPLRQQFLAEATTMLGLKHPHVVPIHDVAEDAGFPYYVMRLARGGSLDHLIDRLRRPDRYARTDAGAIRVPVTGRDDWRGFAALGVQLARAIAFAHACGVLHGDVKPANVLLDEAGDVMVADFGPSTRPDPNDRGRLTGTYRYMAPERFDGECDERSDIYALGATLYELVALVPAFQAEGQDSLVRSILKHELVAPRFIRSNIPPELNALIVKSMARDPADRYPAVADLVAELLNFLEGRPVSAHEQDTRLSAWRRLIGRRPKS